MGENQETPGKPQVLPGFLVQKQRKTWKTTGFVSILSKKQEKPGKALVLVFLASSFCVLLSRAHVIKKSKMEGRPHGRN